MKNYLLLIFIIVWEISPSPVFAQNLKPYFDKEEYKELLYISAKTNTPDSVVFKIPAPEHHKRIYRSDVIGLDNRWDLWINDNNPVAVISIRGTTGNAVSSLANLYAAMVPAKGELILSKTDTFKYNLAPDNQAAVHVGWLLSMALLSEDIVPHIDSLYDSGIKDFVLMGHSQGGAINYLLTAYLYSLQKQKVLPGDIRFKTYCSAAPKPGNLFFAYYYESITKSWAFNVVNSADWVPETPISIQTLADFNETNLFKSAKNEIKKLKFPKNSQDISIHHNFKPYLYLLKNLEGRNCL